MNKHIVNALQKYQFEFNNNWGYGKINGYEVNVINLATATGPMFWFSTNLTLEKKWLFVEKMKNYKISLLMPSYFEFGVMVMIGALTGGTFEKKFDGVLEKILSTLALLDAPKSEICPSSGIELTEDNSSFSNVNLSNGLTIKIRLTNEAVEKVNNLITQVNEEFKSAPNNYLKGFMGIVLGAIAGVIATIIFSYIGIVSALSAFISIFLGVFLYKKFGGKPNWVMIVMAFVTTIVFILGYIVLSYMMFSTSHVAEMGLNLSGFDALKYCLQEYEELASAFRSDIIFNLIFCLIGVFASAFSLIRSINRPKNIN